MENKCKDCKWNYKGPGGTNGWSQCRRYAPRPVDSVTDDWPYVKPDEWCGEFEPEARDE